MRSKLTGYDVGALLYCPANAHGSIVGAIVEQRFPTPYSLAFCLEDTVREDAVADAEQDAAGDAVPDRVRCGGRLLFSAAHFCPGPVTGAAAAAGGGVRPLFSSILRGFILPKFFPGELRGLSLQPSAPSAGRRSTSICRCLSLRP